MNSIDIAVSIVDSPELSEHRQKELALVRLLTIAIDVFLNTEEDDVPLRVDAARDLMRELNHVYPHSAEI